MLGKIGVAESKSLKVPYNILMGQRKKQERKEQLSEHYARLEGNAPMYKQKPNRGKQDDSLVDRVKKKFAGGLEEGKRGLKASVGTYKSGVLHVPESLIEERNRKLSVKKPSGKGKKGIGNAELFKRRKGKVGKMKKGGGKKKR